MRKLLLVLISFSVLSLLTGCWKKADNGNSLVDIDGSINSHSDDSLEDLREKTPMTLDDLDRISKNNFPVSYTYSIYDGDKVVETGGYVYPKNADHNVLIPIQETMVNREVISSVMSHDRIKTVVDITLKNGESYPILFVVDPDTLQYLGASLTTPTTTTLYTFNY